MYTTEAIVTMLIQQLDTFLADNEHLNIWMHAYNIRNSHEGLELSACIGVIDELVGDPIVDIYVRKSRRRARGSQAIPCLDIASIEIVEDYQGKGLFRSFVTAAHQRHAFLMTYIQSVTNPLVKNWCVKHGWMLDPHNEPPCFFLLKDDGPLGPLPQ